VKPEAVKSINSSQMGKSVSFATPDTPINKGTYRIPESPVSPVSPSQLEEYEGKEGVEYFSVVEGGYKDIEDIEDTDEDRDFMTEEEIFEECRLIAENPNLSKITQNKLKRHLNEEEIAMGYIIDYAEIMVENLLKKKTFNKSVANTIEYFKELEESEEKNVVNII
jgi:hypothetical protein